MHTHIKLLHCSWTPGLSVIPSTLKPLVSVDRHTRGREDRRWGKGSIDGRIYTTRKRKREKNCTRIS